MGRCTPDRAAPGRLVADMRQAEGRAVHSVTGLAPTAYARATARSKAVIPPRSSVALSAPIRVEAPP